MTLFVNPKTKMSQKIKTTWGLKADQFETLWVNQDATALSQLDRYEFPTLEDAEFSLPHLEKLFGVRFTPTPISRPAVEGYASESQLRSRPTCIACGKPNHGVVCWHCFKYETAFTPLKYWGGDVESWQRHLVEKGIKLAS